MWTVRIGCGGKLSLRDTQDVARTWRIELAADQHRITVPPTKRKKKDSQVWRSPTCIAILIANCNATVYPLATNGCACHTMDNLARSDSVAITSGHVKVGPWIMLIFEIG